MTGHELDRPAWTALTTRHRPHARGSAAARRYDPAIIPFAASRDDDPESLVDLGRLLTAGDQVIMLQADHIRLPQSLAAVKAFDVVQMVSVAPAPQVDDGRIAALGALDVDEMVALADLAQPGPFSRRSIELGRFWGIRERGALVAMAGERMAQDGYVELSGVCTHPDVRGRGFARLLSSFVSNRIAERGDCPFLHAYAGNAPAIGLYETIGFKVRTMMQAAVVEATAGR